LIEIIPKEGVSYQHEDGTGHHSDEEDNVNPALEDLQWDDMVEPGRDFA